MENIYYNSPQSDTTDNNEGNNLCIIHNTFNNGSIGIALECNTSALTPFFIYRNSFNGNSVCGIYGRKIKGSIKNNNIYSSGKGIYLYQSNPELFNNDLRNYGCNINSNIYSFVRLAPVSQGNQLFWTGGRNNLLSYENNNIDYNDGYAYLEDGENFIEISDIEKYHLNGTILLETEDPIYYVRNNCFNLQYEPYSSLLKSGTNEEVITDYSGSTFNCTLDNLQDYILVNAGYGIYDTIFKSVSQYSPSQSDEELFGIAYQNLLNGNIYNAINNYKLIIDNYPTSNYLNSSLYDLYYSHEELDTCEDQNYRDILFGTLKTYLETKITSGNYSDEFNDIAYDMTLMCLTKMEEYEQALSGYEFIVLFHNNPDVKLLASIDYTEIESLLGWGGSENENTQKMTDEEFIKKRMNIIEKSIIGDPIKEKMKKIYDSKKNKRQNRLEKRLLENGDNNSERIRIMISEKTEVEQKTNQRALNNIRNNRLLNKEETEKRRIEDIFYLINSSSKAIEISRTNSVIPFEYKLSQNYPNPFNPVTKIQYSLPKAGFVTLRIYDILGREVRTLVNEYKNAGRYITEFDGSNLSSGVYFYKLEVNGFKDVKRMMLIK
ncbi:MAG: T9SS type A sorting domain-containing protein [Ignavibacteria bacterium]|nr:T9SS type A sorting domain-containing protein [Ignavibacteria bacterium]